MPHGTDIRKETWSLAQIYELSELLEANGKEHESQCVLIALNEMVKRTRTFTADVVERIQMAATQTEIQGEGNGQHTQGPVQPEPSGDTDPSG
jgi:hypothetical protein